EKLVKGELVTPPRLRNQKIPKSISDIVMKAMAPQIHERYQRAHELLDDVLAARSSGSRRTPRSSAHESTEAAVVDAAQEIQNRLKAREAPQPRFCWQCRKPLHARSDRCPFCGEAQ